MENQIKGQRYREVKIGDVTVYKTINEKFNNWFSLYGGMVAGTNVFVTGTSGAGKTTTVINIMNWLPMLVSAMYSVEMDTVDVKFQTQNVKFSHDNAYIFDRTDCPTIDDFLIEAEKIGAVILAFDSLQAIASASYPNMGEDAGCALVQNKIREYNRKHRGITFVIGHNTKEDEFAGKNTLMQLFDAHIDFFHNKKTDERTMSWKQKNRKGKLGKLFYEFATDGIIFHTPEEWTIVTNGRRSFSDILFKSMESYLSTMDNTTENYKRFKVDFVRQTKELEKTLDGPQFILASVQLLNNLSIIYGV